MENKKQPQVQNDNEILKIRRQKLADLQRAGKDPFQITKYNQSHHTDEVKTLYEAHEKELLAGREPVNVEGLDEARAKEAINNDYNERRRIMDAQPIHVSIAGRMMFKRVMGKASFCNIQDLKGKIQVYVSKDAVGEECYADLKRATLVIFTALPATLSEQKQGKFQSMRILLHFFQRACRFCRKNSTVLQIPIQDTVRDMLTLS